MIILCSRTVERRGKGDSLCRRRWFKECALPGNLALLGGKITGPGYRYGSIRDSQELK